MTTPTVPPLRYAPSLEKPAPDEARTIESLGKALRRILETTSKDYGHAVRSVHAKGHGLVRGTLTIRDGLPVPLAQGLFAAPARHEAILRVSTTPGDLLDDSVSAPRGIALKVLGVEGERLEGVEGDATQDFLMVNGPVFGAPDPAAFLENLELLARTTDRAEGAKKVASAVLRTVESVLEAFGRESVSVQALGGAPEMHPLGQTYYSQTPYRHGDYVAKYSLAPISPWLAGLAEEKVDVAGRPDAIREEVRDVMITHGGAWELRAQLATTTGTTPVEDATVRWDEEETPFVALATFEAPAQSSWEGEASVRTEDALSFSPWHGLTAHRPLGGINRARRSTYDFSARYRGDFNRCPVREPASLGDLA